jgi:hypothetical protein
LPEARPGLLLRRNAQSLNLGLGDALMIGDADMGAARAAGMRGIRRGAPFENNAIDLLDAATRACTTRDGHLERSASSEESAVKWK